MKNNIYLVCCCLLSVVLLLSSCFKVVPDTTTAPSVEQPTTSAPVTESPPVTPPTPTTPAPSPTETAITSDDSWGEWGPLKWPEEFKATSGARLDFIKKEEITVGGKTAIIYYLMAVGLPKDKVYHLWVKSLSNPTPTELTYELQIDDSGYVKDGQGRFQAGIQAPVKGEGMEFALMTVDKTTGTIGKVIAYPIESKQGPYRLWVELRSKKGDLFSIYGEGFSSNEEVTYTSVSENEKASGKVKADDKGL